LEKFLSVTPIDRLLAIMEALRDPVHGCPWDREQDFQSIVPHTIEEAYEVADAVTRGDMDDLRDELGDLLFQVVFQARLAREQGAFDFHDVANAISDKLERRHPHVFGGEKIASSLEQSRAWEAHKLAERDASRHAGERSALQAVHPGRPALQYAAELQHAAAAVGFDWPEATSVVAKLREELGELEAALGGGQNHERAVEELGDLLFTCVNFARHMHVDADSTLRQASVKFETRFRGMEKRASKQGRTLEGASLAELDALWEAAKRDPAD
jgi:nucleoside triphosphate diphosphatase